MNVNDVITKLKVMLGAEEVVTVKLAEATLVDGTEVYTEGELEVGAILFVRAGEGVSEDPFAPAGKHETTDGAIITVGENGEISAIDMEADAEPVKEEEDVEVELEEEVEVKEEIEKVFNAEDLVEAIAEMLIPQTEVIEELRKELSVLKERFEVVANEPATGKVTTNTFKEILADKDAKMTAKLNMLRKLRN
tara:strand:+ start:8080 stop:8658 length:579 start_codon:yes stop_codon:yes gene_type:complete